jgi:NitT/TauT family transport system substrate-binding protein
MNFLFAFLRRLCPVALLLFGSFALAQPIKVGVGIDAAFAPFFVAQQRGLFKQAGLDVTLVRFAQGGEAMDALAAGQVMLGGSAEMTTMVRMSRADLRPLAIYEQSGSYIKLVARSPITEVSQIRKFGIVRGSSSEYAAVRALQKFGVDRQSVQLVPVSPPEMPALLARADIDAYFAWEPWPDLGRKQGGRVLLTSGDVGYAFAMWLTASGPWLQANPEAAKKMLAVLAEVNRQIVADPVKASEDLQAQTKLPAASTLDFLKSTQWKVRDFTPADLEGYEQIAEFMAAQKITPTKVDVKRSLHVGFYKD